MDDPFERQRRALIKPRGGAEYPIEGMTLRDYFAAAALVLFTSDGDLAWQPDEIAEGAFMMADAMLRKRAI